MALHKKRSLLVTFVQGFFFFCFLALLEVLVVVPLLHQGGDLTHPLDLAMFDPRCQFTLEFFV